MVCGTIEGVALPARENALANPGERFRGLVADGLLMLCGLVWGSSFPQVKAALANLTPAGLLTLRFGLTILLLAPLAWFRRRNLDRRQLEAGVICGLWLLLTFAAQTAGLALTTATRSGFLTGLYVVLVPLGGLILWRRHPGRRALWGAGAAALGLYLLTGGDLGPQLNLATPSPCLRGAAAATSGPGRYFPAAIPSGYSISSPGGGPGRRPLVGREGFPAGLGSPSCSGRGST